METFAPVLEPDTQRLIDALMARHHLDRGIRHLTREDVRQHLLEACCRALVRFRPGDAKATTFLYTRIAGECKQLIRMHGTRTRSGRERPYPARLDLDDDDERADLGTVDDGVDELEDLKLALQALPAKHRLTLHLLYFEELTVNEVAARLGSTVSAVRTFRDQALVKARQAMVDGRPHARYSSR